MTDLTFTRNHALEAIDSARKNGREWLYKYYPKPNGQIRPSTTGFLLHMGEAYPVKPLGRLASEISGQPMADNPQTNVFRKHFESLGFQLITSPDDEAASATDRQRHLAEVWSRPNQAKFRRAVFDIFGARCLVTGCETLVALEAAHILPVSSGGSDEGWNGIPLRSDIHRLFDAGAIILRPETLTLSVSASAQKEYGSYQGINLKPIISTKDIAPKLVAALQKRQILYTS